jgi:aryl-alcohol dehydrogenase-like predicted oxidoreductase
MIPVAQIPESGMAKIQQLDIPTRPFGRTGTRVSILGLGGWHLGVPETDREAVRLVHRALAAGITFMDNAWDYNDGLSEERMGKALAGRRGGAFLMTKVCTHGRDARTAMRQLEDSLRRLRTDYLDLWQIHEVVFDDEPARYFARGGAVEALDRAREQGKVRFVGFTGHKDPRLHLEMLAHDYRWDACQLPLNCFDASFRSFEHRVLPELNRRGIAAIGMKSLGGDARAVVAKVVSAQDALSYALSLPVATVVSGIDTLRVLRQNVSIAAGFKAMTARQRQALGRRVADHASDGRFELYKISAAFEGVEARKQHGLPSQQELAG